MKFVFDRATIIALAIFLLAAVASRGDEPHWAYQPVARPTVPRVKSPDSSANPIDRFIVKRLEAEGVSQHGKKIAALTRVLGRR